MFGAPPAAAKADPHPRHPGIFTLQLKSNGTHTMSLATRCDNTVDVAAFEQFKDSDENQRLTHPMLPFDVIVTNINNNGGGDGAGDDNKNNKKQQQQESLFRVLNPFRSHLGAAIVAGLQDLGGILRPGSRVLYVGPSVAHTATFIADAVSSASSSSSDGRVFVVPTESDPARCVTSDMLSDLQNSETKCDFKEGDNMEPSFSLEQQGAGRTVFSTALSGPMRIASCGPVSDPRDVGAFGKELTDFCGGGNSSDEFLDGVFVDMAAAVNNSVSPADVLGGLIGFLKSGAHWCLFLDTKAAATSNKSPDEYFASIVSQVRTEHDLKPREQLTLEPFLQGCAVLVGVKP